VQTGGGGSASGFIMDDDGHVITNHHLIGGSARVTLVLNDGSTALGRVIGSDDVRIGEQVIAVGSPLGLNGTLTAGVVSALDRSSQWSTQPLLQSDASINPDKLERPTRGPGRPRHRGQQLDRDPGRQAGNIGIAIPVDDAAAIAERIIAE
jgi:putative serine protease PepD